MRRKRSRAQWRGWALRAAYVVHGSDGLGELTITGPSTVFEIAYGHVNRTTVSPEDFGIAVQSGESLQGGDARRNASMAEAIFAGERGAPRDIVLVNSALALIAAGKASGYKEGAALAAESIDSGAASRKLIELRSV